MGKRGPAAPDDETCLKAWELNVRGSNLPAIAETFGVSVATARRWRNRGRDLARELHYGPDGELQAAAQRERVAATMQEVKRVLFESVETGNVDIVQAALAIIKAEDTAARLLGYAAPTASKVAVSASSQRPDTGPAPFIVDAVNDYETGRARGEIEP